MLNVALAKSLELFTLLYDLNVHFVNSLAPGGEHLAEDARVKCDGSVCLELYHWLTSSRTTANNNRFAGRGNNNCGVHVTVQDDHHNGNQASRRPKMMYTIYSVVANLQPSVWGTWGRGWAHLIARQWVPISFPLIHLSISYRVWVI